MSKNMIYNVTDFQRHLWNYHKMSSSVARQSEKTGSEKYEAFPIFSSEVFHRMFVEKPERNESPPVGSDVFEYLHERISEIPEFENLRMKCVGNEEWSGIGTAAVIDTLITAVPDSDRVPDVSSDAEIERMFKEAIANASNDDERDRAQQAFDEQMKPDVAGSLANRMNTAKNATQMIDETEVRNAIRTAVKDAIESIEEQEAIVDSLSFGMDPHSGKKAKMALHRNIAKILGGNKRIQEIAKIAGRMRRIALEQQRQKPTKGTDEVTGIEQGSVISKMIPSEFLFMDDSIEAIFASKLHEQSLLQFELSKTPKKEQGPIVMLIDSSGSMSGGPDIWAAAVALAFLEIAYRQKRAFSLVFFGGSVIKEKIYTEWGNINHATILEDVSFFAADGGTNFEDPLNRGIEIIRNNGSFENADIVMITDGISAISADFLSRWKQQKAELSFSCYSILVGGGTSIDTNRKFSDEVEFLNDVIKSDQSMHRFFKVV